jgi:hypothetical protein
MATPRKNKFKSAQSAVKIVVAAFEMNNILFL